MSELAGELEREQAVVDRALARLDQLRADALRRERESLRPTGGSPQAVYERDVTALAAAARRVDLDAAGEGLVFGRLDVLDGAPLHVGRLGMRTEDQEPIVVDWRAPAAAPFYQATAAEPLARIAAAATPHRVSRHYYSALPTLLPQSTCSAGPVKGTFTAIRRLLLASEQAPTELQHLLHKLDDPTRSSPATQSLSTCRPSTLRPSPIAHRISHPAARVRSPSRTASA